MTVDLLTIYIVILLNSATLTIIWLAIWRLYPGFPAARTWTFAAGTATLGGVVLTLAEPMRSLTLIIGGNGLVLLGFCLYWIGVRGFLGRPAPWRTTIVLIAVSLAVLYLFQDNRTVRNLVYALCQSLPLLFAVIDLLRRERPTAGVAIASIGLGASVLSHVMAFGAVAANANGLAPFEVFSAIYTASLLAEVFVAMVWNFGFVLMVIDRLRAELIELAHVDDLTGLPNRRAFQERGSAAVARSLATGHPVALMIVDLDNFKQINDEFGHMAGDACLRHFGLEVGRLLRPQDLLARTGGDEFCLLLPGTELLAATAIAEGLMETFRGVPLSWRGQPIQPTLSIGIAALPSSGVVDIESLTDRADGALYEAKRRGRNGYVAADIAGTGPSPVAG